MRQPTVINNRTAVHPVAIKFGRAVRSMQLKTGWICMCGNCDGTVDKAGARGSIRMQMDAPAPTINNRTAVHPVAIKFGRAVRNMQHKTGWICMCGNCDGTVDAAGARGSSETVAGTRRSGVTQRPVSLH